MAQYCLMKTAETNPRAVEIEGQASSQVVENKFDSNIDEWNYKWDGPVVTWSLDNENDDIQPYSVQRILTLAFMGWGLHTKQIRFRLIRNTKADKPADIRVAFKKAAEDDLFSSSPGVLAYAYFPTKTSKIGGDVTFNDDYIWSRDGKGISAHLVNPEQYPDENTPVKIRTYNLQHTAIHEIGHAIGLKHAQNCPKCVMHPYYNGEVFPQANDLERVQGIYEARVFKNARRYEVLSKRVREMWTPRDVPTMKKQMSQRKAMIIKQAERQALRKERLAKKNA